MALHQAAQLYWESINDQVNAERERQRAQNARDRIRRAIEENDAAAARDGQLASWVCQAA